MGLGWVAVVLVVGIGIGAFVAYAAPGAVAGVMDTAAKTINGIPALLGDMGVPATVEDLAGLIPVPLSIEWHAANQERLVVTWEMGRATTTSFTLSDGMGVDLDGAVERWQSGYANAGVLGTRAMSDDIRASMDESRQRVAAGLDMWSRANPWMEFVEGPRSGLGPHLVVVEVLTNCLLGTVCGETLSAGCSDCLGGSPYILLHHIHIDTPHQYTNAVAHEFGHVLGLEHHHDSNYIMHVGDMHNQYMVTPATEYDNRGLVIPKPWGG